MEIPLPDGSQRIVDCSEELFQASFGVECLQKWPLCHYAKPTIAKQHPQKMFQLFIVFPNHGEIEALVSSGITVLRGTRDGDNRHQIEVDEGNFTKLDTHMRTHESREAELWSEAHEWFENILQLPNSSKDTVLHRWHKLIQESFRDPDIMASAMTTTCIESREHGAPLVTSATRNTLHLESGEELIDASCGAAVSCLGYEGLKPILDAIASVSVFYTCRSFSTVHAEDFKANLMQSTDGEMVEAYIYNSGSDANEAALKLARQFHCNKGQIQRVHYIACSPSYHGSTLATLSVGSHQPRRKLYEDILPSNTHHQVPGYMQAMRDVCDQFGALLIFDEIMCGAGRTGKLHAWQHYGVAPDIQTMGKSLGAGVQPIAAMMCNKRVDEVISAGSGSFVHGHTYEGHPIVCAVGNVVLNTIRRLQPNIEAQGRLLGVLVREGLKEHPNIGDVRGIGLFWAIVIVQEGPSPAACDGTEGDDVVIAPQYTSTEYDIRTIATRTIEAVQTLFDRKLAGAS
ncbi:pyridoxal phosphate-dependent transferase [Paraphoma chrysanthemicola]|nr:pyridoxal phosphate-dependent transferase [Paraphoma chrysanthemicola]